MRTPSQKAKSTKTLKDAIAATTKLWRRFHLDYDQARYVAKEARTSLGIKRTKTRKQVVERLSGEEGKQLISQAYCVPCFAVSVINGLGAVYTPMVQHPC